MYPYVYIYIYIYTHIHDRSGATQCLWPMMTRAAPIEDRATVSVGHQKIQSFQSGHQNSPLANLCMYRRNC